MVEIVMVYFWVMFFEGVERETLKNFPFMPVLLSRPLYIKQVLFRAVDFEVQVDYQETGDTGWTAIEWIELT